MVQRARLKTFLKIALVLIPVVLLVSVLLFVSYQSTSIQDKPEVETSPNYAKPRHEIKGFRFNSNREGKDVVSITADKFSIRKKKLGFFRIGLMSEAMFENAVVHLYGRELLEGNQPSSKEKGPNFRQKIPRVLTFDGVLKKEALPSFPIKRISAVIMEPVSLVLHDERSVVTQISAISSVIRLKNRDILFRGNVRVVSGGRVLTTDHLSLKPVNAALRTDGQYRLSTPEKNKEGKGLTTDIFLNDSK